MISANNQPLNLSTNDADFTIGHYRELIRLAKKNYQFVTYDAFPANGTFILWRHDCDFSLNRSCQLSVIEQEEGVESTYFINPHCEFYNPFENSQAELISNILSRGHKLALHFDAAFYDISTEEQLNKLVEQEATMLQMAFGTRPEVFSFHNPTEYLLTCEKERYGGLLNTYSKRFKENVPYCSDSNGYWRFTRLRDVLEKADAPCLQVLTHPGWWQDIPLLPRQRIFRSVYGRAEATLCEYDTVVENFSRINHAGDSSALMFLKSVLPETYLLCDYLWNKSHFNTLFIELWRLHERQIKQLCRMVFSEKWLVSENEVNAFFEDANLSIDGWNLIVVTFEQPLEMVVGVSETDHKEWVSVRNQLILGKSTIPKHKLEEGCIYLCDIIESLIDAPMKLFGQFDNIPQKKWESFKSRMLGNRDKE
jgi:hypothetical protein